MAVLLLAEVNGNELAVDATAKAVSAATALGDVTVLCASAGCGAAASAAAQLDGVGKVLCADDAAYGMALQNRLQILSCHWRAIILISLLRQQIPLKIFYPVLRPYWT